MCSKGQEGQAWFCTTGLPSDIVIEVDEMSFHLHKFPLMSKSRKLHQLITEQETRQQPSSSNKVKLRTIPFPADSSKVQEVEEEEEEDKENERDSEDEEIMDEEPLHIVLPDFPDGSETFEIAAKFCYGVKISLSPSTVAPLRCAGEYLEMTEEYSEENLISKTELYFTQVVLKNIKQSLLTLKSCEALSPMAETLEIPQRCIDAIVSKASSSDPLFSWPVNDGSGEDDRALNQVLWNGIDTGIRRKNATRASDTEPWFEDLGVLCLNLFKQVISAMQEQHMSSEVIERCLIAYARKSIPGLSRSMRKQSASSLASEAEQRELIETIIMNIPPEKSSRLSSATKHLFGLLRTANILNASESCRAVLERKIASQLDQASLDDLLIPSYSYLIETLYDVDCVERILGYFLEKLEDGEGIEVEGEDGGNVGDGGRTPVMMVGKLIDGYLSEIASDANLKPKKFCDLAVALPDQARVYDDGLYRAVDVYLKAHPWLTEEEREKICGVLDCHKLTLEACTHAAQNERLPLRAVVQVLFFEQVQLRQAIAGSLLAVELAPSESARPSLLPQQQQLELVVHNNNAGEVVPAQVQRGNTWRAAIRENQVLRFDMDSMRSRVNELERECSTMKKAIEKIDKVWPLGNRGWRSSLTKKFGCKFKTQVCDSHERTVVEANKRGGGRHQPQQSL